MISVGVTVKYGDGSAVTFTETNDMRQSASAAAELLEQTATVIAGALRSVDKPGRVSQ